MFYSLFLEVLKEAIFYREIQKNGNQIWLHAVF